MFIDFLGVKYEFLTARSHSIKYTINQFGDIIDKSLVDGDLQSLANDPVD